MIKEGVVKEGLTRCCKCGKEAHTIRQDNGRAFCHEHAVQESKTASLEITSLKDASEGLSDKHTATL